MTQATIKTYLVVCSFLILLGLTFSASAHKYFFGITDVRINADNDHIEIIHQYAYHDIDLILKSRLSAEEYNDSSRFEYHLKDYIDQYFKLYSANTSITINWVGYEIDFGQLIIYQEVVDDYLHNNLRVENRVIIEQYPMQINTINYSSHEVKGSLTLDNKIQNLLLPLK